MLYEVITQPPRVRQGPREKLAAEGVAALSDAELLALLLGTGAGGLTVADLAQRLIRSFGGLRGLLQASRARLECERGLGPARAAQLLAVLELSRRCLREALLRGDPIESPRITSYNVCYTKLLRVDRCETRSL